MKCFCNETECHHYDKDTGDCKINTCFDEYDIAEGKPYPNKEIKEYWERMK